MDHFKQFIRAHFILSSGLATDQQQQTMLDSVIAIPQAKRTGSVSNIVEGASPSKRRKMNSNENCSMIDDSDAIMSTLNLYYILIKINHTLLADMDIMNTSKMNILGDASSALDIKPTPLTVISNDDGNLDSTSTCTLLVPKRKQPLP